MRFLFIILLAGLVCIRGVDAAEAPAPMQAYPTELGLVRPALGLKIRDGQTLTIQSGATIVADAGSTVTGFGGAGLPDQTGHNGEFLTTDGSSASWAASSGSGTVTNFTAGTLSPIFTTAVANPTTAPALTFALTNQDANKVFAGPTSGGAGAPTVRSLVAADIPSLSATYLPLTGGTMTGNITFNDTGEGVALHGGATILGASGGVTVTASGTNQNVTIVPSGTGSALYGHSTPLVTSSGAAPFFQISGSTAGDNSGRIYLEHAIDNAAGVAIYGVKNRSGVVGTYNVTTQSGDVLNAFIGEGSDGSGGIRRGASIVFSASANFTATSSPGNISLRTTAPNSVIATERVRISTDASDNGVITVNGINSSSAQFSGEWAGTSASGRAVVRSTNAAGTQVVAATFGGDGAGGTALAGNLTVSGATTMGANLTFSDTGEGLSLHGGGTVTGASGNVTLTPGSGGGILLSGKVGVGAAQNDNILLTLGDVALSSGTGVFGAYGAMTVPSGATGTSAQFFGNMRTAAASFTASTLSNFRASSAIAGGGSTISVLEGFTATSGMTQGTNNYGFRGQLAASGTARWNTYMDGTAPNYFAGEVLIGSSTDQGAYALQVTGETIMSGNLTVSGTGLSPFAGPVGLVSAASPTTSAAGNTAFDNNAHASGRGAIQVYDGTANTYVVAALASDTPTNGQVPTWNTGGTITWETAAGSGNVTGGALTANAVIIGGGSNAIAPLASLGNSGEVLTSAGAGAPPVWSAAGAGNVTNSGTLTSGSIIIGGGTTVVAATTTGTGVVTALGVNVGSAGAVVVNGGALGTPSGGTLTNATGLPTAGLVDGAVTLAKMANLAQDQFIGRTTGSTGVPETATITAAARTVLDDTTVGAMVDTLGGASSTGTGGIVRTTSATLVTPALGTPSSVTLTNATGLPIAGLTAASQAQGDVIYFNGTNWVRLGAGTSGHFLKTNGTGANPEWAAGGAGGGLGYALCGNTGSTTSPADSSNYYFGTNGRPVSTTEGNTKHYVPKAGTLKVAEVFWFASTTAGSGEDVSVYVRVNGTTDTLIATVGTTDATKRFSNTGLSVSLAQGDYFEIKIVTPAWATNPGGVQTGYTLYIE